MNATMERISPSAGRIARWAREFESESVDRILEWAVAEFAPRLVMTSNFGVEGVVVLDHLRRIAPATPVLYVETGYQFAETDRLKEEVRARLGVNIIEVRAELSVEEQDRIYGERLHSRDSDLCCRLRKVEPLASALAPYDAWIAALRRDASPTREGIGVVEWNERRRMVKINPIAGWTRERVWDYIFSNRLPYNSLYDDGFTSIGCAPCTRRTSAGEHERSGRWDGEKKLECGIHL
ncbi:MAG: phosphoadenylyl-sulfate reductase [Acidobacteria bacterium]|nr:phosphoadenylyl-sulfate reductase [Acidobacteriota bacterium]MCW5971504.1 phosphoadenylyl-sulfate reductase [Blastocatellales bacterium]